MGKRITLFSLGLVLLVSAGCTTDTIHRWVRANPAPLSKYLPAHELLTRQPDTFPFQYAYVAKNIPPLYYRNIYIAPVNTQYLREGGGWASFDKILNGHLGNTVEALAIFMRRAYETELASVSLQTRLRVTRDRRKPRTIVVEPAVVTITPTKAELNAAGFVGGLFIPGLGLAAGFVSSGTIVVECIIRDGDTGRILAMYADTETDPKALLNISGFTWTRSAQINMKTIARYTAALFVAGRNGDVRRDFPLHFFSFIHEGEL